MRDITPSNRPVLISGPLVSSAMARHGLKPLSFLYFSAAFLQLSMVSPWYSWEPWLKFILAIFMPASIMS